MADGKKKKTDPLLQKKIDDFFKQGEDSNLLVEKAEKKTGLDDWEFPDSAGLNGSADANDTQEVEQVDFVDESDELSRDTDPNVGECVFYPDDYKKAPTYKGEKGDLDIMKLLLPAHFRIYQVWNGRIIIAEDKMWSIGKWKKIYDKLCEQNEKVVIAKKELDEKLERGELDDIDSYEERHKSFQVCNYLLEKLISYVSRKIPREEVKKEFQRLEQQTIALEEQNKKLGLMLDRLRADKKLFANYALGTSSREAGDSPKKVITEMTKDELIYYATQMSLALTAKIAEIADLTDSIAINRRKHEILYASLKRLKDNFRAEVEASVREAVGKQKAQHDYAMQMLDRRESALAQKEDDFKQRFESLKQAESRLITLKQDLEDAFPNAEDYQKAVLDLDKQYELLDLERQDLEKERQALEKKQERFKSSKRKIAQKWRKKFADLKAWEKSLKIKNVSEKVKSEEKPVVKHEPQVEVSDVSGWQVFTSLNWPLVMTYGAIVAVLIIMAVIYF